MELRILHYADLEDTYDNPDHIGRVAGLINSLRDRNTLVIGAGDNIAPSGLALVTNGHQAIEFFDAIEPDIDTLGNHDFDYGLETLFSVVRESPQCWICANAFLDGDRLGQEAGIVPWTVIERGDQRLGLFGLSHPNTDANSPNARSLSFTEPIAAARDAIEALRDHTVDHILCVSHLGKSKGRPFNDDIDLACAVDVDVILGGHEHGDPRINRVDGTLLVRTSGEGQDLAELRYGNKWTATLHDVAAGTNDMAVKQRFNELRSHNGLNEIVAKVNDPIIQTTETRYQGESRLGNVIADAYRWETNADIGLQHSSGIRGTTLQGEVTVADIVCLVPFDMQVVRVEVSGTTLHDMLASGGEIIYPENPEYWQIHLSGGTITFDYTMREIVAASVDGEPITKSSSYTVAAPENLIHTFDMDRSGREKRVGQQYEVLADYARANGLNSEIEGRIIRQGI